MKHDYPQIKVRIPPAMMAFLESEAASNASTKSSEIVRCIREKMDRLKQADQAA